MTMFDVRYLYLFFNDYLIYIKGVIAFTRKKKIFIQKTNQNIFVCIYFLKKFFIQKKKTQIYNYYHKLIWLSSYEKKKLILKIGRAHV